MIAERARPGSGVTPFGQPIHLTLRDSETSAVSRAPFTQQLQDRFVVEGLGQLPEPTTRL